MPTKFIVSVRTKDAHENSLGDFGATESPIIDAIKNALTRFNISLETARHGPAPRVFPPWYMVIAETSGDISTDDFKGALDDVWSGTKDQEGNPVPEADINVQDQD
ncbi:hypothetical protein ASPWEDRAFT_33549, partial [Aspergillus wentii DTO 134E9]